MKKGFIKVSTLIASGIGALLSLFGLTACDPFEPRMEYGTPHADFEVKATVQDPSGKPIEGIEIGFQSNQKGELIDAKKAHTDAKGHANVQYTSFPSEQTFTVYAKDIDGAKNGEWQMVTQSVLFQKSDLSGKSQKWYSGKAIKEVTFKLQPVNKQ